MNPQTKTFDFISSETPQNEIDSYQPSLAQSLTMFKGEADYEAIFDMLYNRATGADAHRDALIVFYKESSTYTPSGASEEVTIFKAWKIDALVTFNQLDSVNENIDFENTDGNIAISYDATGNKFTYNLSPNLNLGPAGSLRIGDALLNNGGLTIVNGPSITSAGVDAGNKKITNVADGTIGAGSKDAINGGQLHDVQTNLQTSINNNAQNIANNTNAINNLNAAVNNPITFTGDSGNNIDRKLGETLNIKGGATGNLTSGNIGVEADSTTNTLNVKLAENIDLGTNGSVKMGDTKINDNGLTINGGPSVTKAGIDAGNKKVTNVANGDITATSKDAVNGSQLHGVADSIKNSIGGNTILNPDGTITTNNIGGIFGL